MKLNFFITLCCIFIGLTGVYGQESSSEESSKPGGRNSFYIGFRNLDASDIPNLNYTSLKPINEFVNLGIGIGYQEIFWSKHLGFVARAEGNIIPIINAIAGNELDVKGLEFYAGIQGGYVFSLSSFENVIDGGGLDGLVGFSTFGPYAGGRYFFSDRMGIMVEFGKSPAGLNTFGAGIVFGKK